MNIESVKETTLYKTLLSRNNEDTKAFVGNILTLCEEAADRAKAIPKFFSEYTLHDKTHFLRVTELMAIVIGEKLKDLNDIEIGLLILSAFFHDEGMFIDTSEFALLEKNEQYLIFRDNWFIDHSNYSEIKKQHDASSTSESEKVRLSKLLFELDAAMLTDYLRHSHGQRSYDYIVKNYSNNQILSIGNINLSSYLASVCLSHVKSTEWLSADNGLNYDENIGTYRVNTIFLSIVLRLADILDFDSDRTPDVLFKSIHFTSPVSIAEWQKHRSVKGWEISKELVRFTMMFDHPVYEKTANTFIDWIDAELNLCHALVRKFPSTSNKYGLYLAEKVDRSRLGPKNNSYLYHDLEFTLSRNEIVKLLMTDKLYKKPSLFIRELLQNSLDALRLRKAIYKKDELDWDSGLVSFRHYIDEYDQEVIECSDNGCGMDELVIKKFLGKVGRSYYKSPEFERQRIQLKEKGVDFEPCSQFGIGFMSCFMIGDRIQILTRKDYGHGEKAGKPLIVEINGLGGLIVIKEGNPNQSIGTSVKVFSRKKPFYYDSWNDNIRLVLTLKGYAMATEFPIKAICDIEGIKGELNLPITIDKKRTFLEECEITNSVTFEIDLITINKSLRGCLRQTFLLDSNGLPCTENEEAKWDVKNSKQFSGQERNEITLLNKLSNTEKIYHTNIGLRNGHSVCLDGILVCGYPGRAEYSEYEMSMLGHLASKVSSEHPFTLDIRGDIKPELSPAREPIEGNSFLDVPVGWKYIQHLVNAGSGLMWSKVLNLSENGLSPETFWKLLVIHDGSLLQIPFNILIKYLQLPIANGGWIKLSSIKSFFPDENGITLKADDGKQYNIDVPKSLIEFGKAQINGYDFTYRLSNILFCHAQFDLGTTKSDLTIRSSFSNSETATDHLMSWDMTTLRFIPFVGIDKDYITTTKLGNIVNSENELAKYVLENRFIKQKDELFDFARAFIFNICYLISEQKKANQSFNPKGGLRSLKFTSAMFFNMDWSKYAKHFGPPYKIKIDDNTTVEITEANFRYWKELKYRDFE